MQSFYTSMLSSECMLIIMLKLAAVAAATCVNHAAWGSVARTARQRPCGTLVCLCLSFQELGSAMRACMALLGLRLYLHACEGSK